MMGSQRAFTLFELAIVLVIIALIVGGVVVGNDIIRAAQLQKVITQVEQFQTAIKAFEAEYGALPGDMTNATDFWGEVTSGVACPNQDSTGVETCDGNGDGLIYANDEGYRAWQQLAFAGYLNGYYAGGSSGLDENGLGFNPGGCSEEVCPPGAIPDSLFELEYSTTRQMQHFSFGDDDCLGLNHWPPYAPVLHTIDALNIDTKIDDANPVLGNVTTAIGKGGGGTYYTEAEDCSTSTDPAVSIYDLTRDELSCALFFYWE